MPHDKLIFIITTISNIKLCVVPLRNLSAEKVEREIEPLDRLYNILTIQNRKVLIKWVCVNETEDLCLCLGKIQTFSRQTKSNWF